MNLTESSKAILQEDAPQNNYEAHMLAKAADIIETALSNHPIGETRKRMQEFVKEYKQHFE